jgi:DHA1 family tetracycline resistance protein-like MFS transporter
LTAPSPPVQPGSRRAPGTAAFIFVFITVVLDMMALGITVPVIPKLILHFQHGDVARAAWMVGVFATLWALMQFLCAPLIGAASDRFGRRPVLLLSSFGLGLDYLVMAVAPTLGWLFAGRLISGITAASYPTAGAYIADVTPPAERASRFGMLGAAFGLGFIVGPAVGGLLGAIDLRLPFWVAAGLSLVNTAYGYFILPESLPRTRRKPFSFRSANVVGTLQLLRSHPELLGLAGAVFVMAIAHESLPNVFVLYTHQRYGWGESQVGVALALIGVSSVITSMWLVKPMVRRFGERRAILIGLACGVAGFLDFGLAHTGLQFLVGIAFLALLGVAGPSLQSMMSHRVGGSEQGQLQGALGSLRAITGMMGPLLFTHVFALTVRNGGHEWLGTAYVLAGLILLGTLIVGLRAIPRSTI